MPLPPGAFWYFGSELAGHHPGRRDIDRHVEHRDRDDSGGVVEHEVAGSEGAAAGTNGHGLVVELVPGEGELWPRNVGNELGSKITVAAPRQARPERDKDGPVRLCLLVARHICYQMQQIIIVI